MKILLIANPELPVPPGKYGGIERIIDVLVNGFVEQGHSVTICANAASKVPCELIEWSGMKSLKKSDLLKNLFTVTKLVYTRKFDVVHCFGRLAYMTGILPLSVPKIMSYQLEPSVVQISKAKKIARKNTLTFTGCSDYITNQIKPIATAYTIYNCAPFERYTVNKTIDTDAPLMFLGRLEHIKGTHIAIDIAKRAGKRLIIAGNVGRGHEEYFETQVKPHLNDRIVYVGPVDDAQKNELLGQSLAFLMPVLWDEPFGIVMAEALACGTPVIGFPRGSVPEVVENGKTGFVCKSVEEMVNALDQCKYLDRESIRRRGEQRFGNKTIVNQYLDLYNKVMN
jgi:glycosyltransferase involved in cell wall biosynthesis